MNAYAAQLQDMTRTDLYNLAKDANLPGRSKMTKDQLIEALTDAQAEVLATQAPEVEEYYTENETPASDHNPDTDGQVAAVDFSTFTLLTDIEPQRVYTTPIKPTRVKALITRDVPGAAFFNLSNGIGGVIVREKNRFELVTGSGETITVRARTMVKAVKRLAVKLGIYLDAIDTVKAF